MVAQLKKDVNEKENKLSVDDEILLVKINVGAVALSPPVL